MCGVSRFFFTEGMQWRPRVSSRKNLTAVLNSWSRTNSRQSSCHRASPPPPPPPLTKKWKPFPGSSFATPVFCHEFRDDLNSYTLLVCRLVSSYFSKLTSFGDSCSDDDTFITSLRKIVPFLNLNNCSWTLITAKNILSWTLLEENVCLYPWANPVAQISTVVTIFST